MEQKCVLVNKGLTCKGLARGILFTWTGKRRTLKTGVYNFGLKTDIESFAFNKNFGKVWLTNHGLDSLFNSVQSEWRNFCKLDQEEKENFSAPRYFTVEEYKNPPNTEVDKLLTFSQFTFATFMVFKRHVSLIVLAATEVLDITRLGQRQLQGFYKENPEVFSISFLVNKLFDFHFHKYCLHFVLIKGTFHSHKGLMEGKGLLILLSLWKVGMKTSLRGLSQGEHHTNHFS